MKFLYKIIALLVGVLFIFSGLIKLNDPIGTAIKFEEYFEVFAASFWSGFAQLTPYSVIFSLIFCIAEIVLGVMLLLRYKPTLTLWLLFILISFFTFLTFYSAYYNKVTDCGCFGDAIKLKPWESFTKDIILLVLILVLFFTRRGIQANKSKIAPLVTLFTVIITLGLGLYALMYLPFIDFRAYKVGTDIPKHMQPSAPLKYKYIMERNGKIFEFTEYPSDTTYTFKEAVIVNPEAMPKINDYNLWNEEGDQTQASLTGKKLLVVFHTLDDVNPKETESVNKLIEELKGSDIEPVAVTSSGADEFEAFRHEAQLAVPYCFADAVMLKTMMRANPGLVLLKDGVVKGKWSWRNTPDKLTLQAALH